MVTKSYDQKYKCITCTGDRKHSIFDKESITVIVGDESSRDTLPVMADGSCAAILKYGG